MAKVSWRSAYSYSPQISDGGTMDACLLGRVEVGRVQKVGNKGAWICWLPTGHCGMPLSSWRYEKSWLAARSALAARVREFVAASGLEDIERPSPPAPEASSRPAIQQELFNG